MSSERHDLLAQALSAIEKLEAKLQAAERNGTAPIAIVGMGCRYPAAVSSPDEFWDALAAGRDAVVEIPAARWSRSAIKTTHPGARFAALLDRIDSFDAPFFGIAGREAVALDPQQRLLLEVTWESLEHAGIVPGALKGSDTGVFIGICSGDYQHQFNGGARAPLDAYAVTGNMMSTAAGRLSYVFGFQGPCMALDTACSSSLVAIHLACHSLRFRESRIAIAGGVSLILSPRTMEGLAETQALSPDGRSRAFDAGANGFVRGEGCGIVVLKRLEDALADGDRIWACIRGSAVNQDGRSTGLTTPNVLAQQELLKRALANAQVSPDDIDYIEAHGTGTVLGDPIEFDALREVFGGPRNDGAVCPLGSVKTNIGHLEGAAGVAGLMKVVMALEREQIPRHLHFRTLNPHIALDGTPFVIPTEPIAWPRSGRRRIAGVSSFGMSGTNAHVVLEEAPADDSARTRMRRGRDLDATAPLLVSGRDMPALRAQAERWAAWIEAHPEAPWGDVVDTAARRRTHFTARTALLVDDHATATAALRAVAARQPHAAVVVGQARRGRVAVLFSGQGSQRVGMARGLYESDPVFRAALDEIAGELDVHLDRPLLGVLFAADEEKAPQIHQTAYAQPALFALEVALFRRWQAWGLRPDRLLGHSVGELAAAHVAGVLPLADAAKLVAARGRLMQQCPAGAMVALPLGETDVRELVAPYHDRVDVAAINGPEQTVISGDEEAVLAIAGRVAGTDPRPKRLTVSHAFHSPHMDAMLAAFGEVARTCTFEAPKIPVISNLTGAPAGDRIASAEYWVEHARRSVRFLDGLRTLAADEVTTFLECGPEGVLCALGPSALPEGTATFVPSLKRSEDSLLRAMAQLHVAGVDLDWDRILARPAGVADPGRSVDWAAVSGEAGLADLPRYPWQRERFWIGSGSDISSHDSDTGADHPMLRSRFDPSSQPDTSCWAADLNLDRLPFLRDHAVEGTVVLPATAYLELALAVAGAGTGFTPWVIEGATFERLLAIDPQQPREVQVTLTRTDGAVRIASRRVATSEGVEWTRHAAMTVRRELDPPAAARVDLDAIRARCGERYGTDEYYAALERHGLRFGISFRGVHEVCRGNHEALVGVRLPEAVADADRYVVHPALLDAACFQAIAAALSRAEAPQSRGVFLPVAIRSLRLLARVPATVWAHVTVPDGAVERGIAECDVELIDEHGIVLGSALGISVRQTERETPGGELAWRDWLYELRWTASTPKHAGSRTPQSRRWLVCTDTGRVSAQIVSELTHRGDFVVEVRPGRAFARSGDSHYQIDPNRPEDFSRLLQEAFAGAVCDGLVYLWGLDAAPATELPGAVPEAAHLSTLGALHLVQAVARADWPTSPRLWLVTRGVHAVGSPTAIAPPTHASLWGLGRVVVHEHPELCCTMVDLAPVPDSAQAATLIDELLEPDDEDQIALRGGERFVARLARAEPPRRAAQPPAAGPIQLEIATPGHLDTLRVASAPRRALRAAEVEIEVRAAGLNFRDVLQAMGTSPDQANGRVLLGYECAGRISRVGPGVTHLRHGDEVIALAAAAFGSFAIARAAFVALKPARLDFEAAATLPLAFMTALYSLESVARLRAGERILVHAASGGTGLAAVHLARRLGAYVIGTAGSPAKREFLHSIGVEHVGDSRSPSFVADVMRWTHGRGVDVVLNSLSGELMAASLGVLAPFGRFVELGKRDIYENAQLPLQAFRRNLSYTAVDLAAMPTEQPEVFASLLHEVVDRADRGEIDPLPRRTWPIERAEDGFREMAQARHIGKIVFALPELSAAETEASAPAARTDASEDGWYLITGGLGRLGLHAARWLASRDARTLVLVGRSDPSDQAKRDIEELRARGAAVEIVHADIADPASVERVVAERTRRGSPLKGIVHAAGVLDDGVITRLDGDRLRRTMAPKVAGAWNLHALTLDQPLDFFVMYSSAASFLGSPGQANYAAGNAFLDALAHYRRARGLPALAINWGPFSSEGLAVAAVESGRLAARGIDAMTPAEGLEVFGQLLDTEAVQVGVMRLDLPQVTRAIRDVSRSRLFSELAGRSERPARAGGAMRERLLAAEPRDRLDALESHIRSTIARVTGVDASRIAAHTPFSEIGLDSLMALETRNELESSLSLSLPGTLLWTQPDLDHLAAHLLKALDLRETISESTGGSTEMKSESAKREPPPAAETSPAAPAVEAPIVVDAARVAERDVAIIGAAVRLPDAATPDALFDLLMGGRRTSRLVPAERVQMMAQAGLRPPVDGHMAGYLDDITAFDPEFFGIAESDARHIDPQQRLFLDAAWEALERAGYRPDGLADRRVGVFAGIAPNGFTEWTNRADLQPDAARISGGLNSFAASRIAYCLDLMGPAVAIDAACASSLVAVHLAVQSLRAGETRLCLAGGVNALLLPEVTELFDGAGLLSHDGCSRAYDDAAAGYFRGEGAIVLVLKRARQAIADGDDILAVIKGTAVAQDGRARVGIAAPSIDGQRRAAVAALADAGVEPSTITFVEGHGTATAVGDAMEVEALSAVYGRRPGSCAIGSVKTRLGHLEAAGGAAGILCAALALKRGVVPPNGAVDAPNHEIAFEEMPFFLVDRPFALPRSGVPRRAAVHCYAMGGVNAHAILEEAPASVQGSEAIEARAELFVLSAETLETLNTDVDAILDTLARNPRGTLSAWCRTAAATRRPRPVRLAIVARSLEQLADRLNLFRLAADGRRLAASSIFGPADIGPVLDETASLPAASQTRIRRATSGRWAERHLHPRLVAGAEAPVSESDRIELLKFLGRAFVAGAEIDLSELSSGRDRAPLPPAARKLRRLWPDAEALPVSSAQPAVAASTAADGVSAAAALTTAAPVSAAAAVTTVALASTTAAAVSIAPPASAAFGLAAAAAGSSVEELEGVLWRCLERVAIQPLTRRDPDLAFFDLGVDSMTLARFSTLLEQGLGATLPAKVAFENPTITKLASYLAERVPDAATLRRNLDALQDVAPERVDRDAPFRLTPLQQAYYSAAELGGNPGRSCEVLLELEVDGIADHARLQSALRRLIDRHPMLSVVFTADGMQRYDRDMAGTIELPFESLTAVDDADRHARLAAIREGLLATGADLRRGPLVRTAAVQMREAFRLFVAIDLIAADLESIRLVVDEWRQLYETPDRQLPPLRLRFDRYLQLLDEQTLAERRERDRGYWMDRIDRMPPAPALPLVCDPATARTARYASKQCALPAALWLRFQQRARDEGLTPSALVGAAFGETIARFSDGRPFCLNLPVFDRRPLHPDVDRIVGAFSTNVLVPLAGGTGDVVERARRFAADVGEALEHRTFSGVEVARAIAARRRSAAPVAPVVFTAPLYRRGTTGWGRVVDIRSRTPHVWIDCQAVELDGGLMLRWDYCEELFEAETIATMFRDFVGGVRTLAEAPIPAFDGEQARLRRGFASAAAVRAATLDGIVARQAERSPQLRAVVAGDGAIPYGELDRRANRVANRLRDAGLTKGDRVVIACRRGTDQIASVVGVLRAGAVYVPVDPSQPDARAAQIVEDSRPRAIIADEPERARRFAGGVPQIDPRDAVAYPADGAPPAVTSADDLAYVMFTSGSTGRPKGVMIAHGAAINTIEDINARFDLSSFDRILAFSNLGFDLSVWDLFGSFAAGASVVVLPEDDLRAPDRWLQLMEKTGVTVWNSVPTAMSMLVDFFEGRRHMAAPALRVAMLSGDWIPVTLPDRIRALFPGTDVVSLGGATEGSIWSCIYRIREVDPAWSSIPYGRALTNQSFHVLDEHLQPVPTGELGELFIGGRGVALGYFGDEARTRERFVVGPAGVGRLYRTGDLGRWTATGDMEFLGRKDMQVKIRGFRVEIAEVEAALRAHPAVADCAVSARGAARAEKELIAHYVPRSAVAASDLLQHLRARVPDYMVPQHFVALDELPMSGNGKIDRGGLL